jgi:uncharacterized protein with HEPN domain
MDDDTAIADKGYVWDIVTACEDILQFIDAKTLESFTEDKMCRFAVERQLLVIGEASKKLSEDFKSKYEDIPWRQIIGLRNILAHDYGEILTERIWLVAVDEIPILYNKLKPLR